MFTVNINNTWWKSKSIINLLINCMPAKSVPQILTIKDGCTFRFANFLVRGWCSSSAKSVFCMTSFLTALPAVFYRKIINY